MVPENMPTGSVEPQASVPTGRLWFGLAASAAAWVLLGSIDILITWRACMNGRQSADTIHPAARGLYITAAIAVFAVVVMAGITSYRNWRALSRQRDLITATATERREFMALLGVFVSVTLGMGVLWLALPPLIVQLCERAK